MSERDEGTAVVKTGVKTQREAGDGAVALETAEGGGRGGAGARVAEAGGSIEEMVRRLFTEIGENPDREGLRRTPQRFEKALRFLTSGYQMDEDKLLNNAIFSVCYDEMVVVKDIEIYSLCEHHLLPFFGRCHVAYIPKKRVVGLSKIPRLVNMYARRLQIQERLTRQIADALQKRLEPDGVGVIIEARHLCMVMRGVEKQHSQAVTSAMLGSFRDDMQTRNEFLSLVGKNKG